MMIVCNHPLLGARTEAYMCSVSNMKLNLAVDNCRQCSCLIPSQHRVSHEIAVRQRIVNMSTIIIIFQNRPDKKLHVNIAL